MKKLLYITLILCACIANLQASSDNDRDQNRLLNVLTSILPDVKVHLEEDSGLVVLSGTKENVGSALAKLRDYHQLRKVLIPAQTEQTVVNAAQGSLNTWADFMKVLNIDPTEGLFNTLSTFTSDAEGVYRIRTEKASQRLMAQGYVQELRESSKFFGWAHENIPGFVSEKSDCTTIQYHLLQEFLQLKENTVVDEKTPDLATATLSSQNVLKTMIASVSGQVALQPTEKEGHYRVQTLSLGEHFDQRQVVLDLMIDRSGSMQDDPIRFVNRQIPILFGCIQKLLKPNQSITVRLKSFNTELREEGKYVLRHDSGLPTTTKIKADGGTDLTLITPLLRQDKGERKLVVAFTDGFHECQRSSLDDSLREMEKLRANGNFARFHLCMVGDKSNKYFEDVAKIFNCGYSTQEDMESFFARIQDALTEDLLASRSPLVFELAGSNVNVPIEWVKDTAGIYTSEQTVQEGDTVKFQQTVQKVTVKERIMAEIEALSQQLNKLKDMIK